MVRKPTEPETFIKLALLCPEDDVGVSWSNEYPMSSIASVVERSIAWSAGLVPGMMLKGVKVKGDTAFETLDGTSTPFLTGPGVYPRILVLKFTAGACTVDNIKQSARIRARTLAQRNKICKQLGPVSHAEVLVEAQKTVARQYWIIRSRMAKAEKALLPSQFTQLPVATSAATASNEEMCAAQVLNALPLHSPPPGKKKRLRSNETSQDTSSSVRLRAVTHHQQHHTRSDDKTTSYI
ncbi:hypothetical protein H257_13604 [Aphanomyces astaci]|uniref:Uncharacterized protein n=1 Tax=Aphanomyces astaci TaxID=112090 RepID=W4FUQ7_APHAT|nr:hypothetical protein H257_13604 [Aphanomyces astaci]ETV71230.1 hypothetical protein H257_13604 [Aphanomyces astaci]|eukprot:XP_009839476.1 hypothetical protein H257_13604 [Aphanomyces astaci]